MTQETLKIIACLAMLIDHTGVVFAPSVDTYVTMRIIGRIAFPIYCFLIAEGVHYTSNPKRYGMRLGAGVVLSELPFDLALFGGLTLHYQNVMITLLLGFLSICTMKKCTRFLSKLLIMLTFALAAEALRADYGGLGVILIVMFAYAREMPYKTIWQTVGLTLFCLITGGLEIFAVFAMIPIAMYHEEKRTHSKAVQWIFYLFYPVHLIVLLLVKMVLG